MVDSIAADRNDEEQTSHEESTQMLSTKQADELSRASRATKHLDTTSPDKASMFSYVLITSKTLEQFALEMPEVECMSV